MWARWSLRFRVFLFFGLILFGGAAGIAAGLWLGFARLGDPQALSGFVLSGLIAVFVLGGLVLWVWLLFDENVAKPVTRLSDDLRARLHADVEKELDHQSAIYLGDLGPAASAMADSLIAQRSALAEMVARETQVMAEQTARLEQVLRDMPDGVVLCTSAHRIALYNAQVATLFAGSDLLGLDRNIFDLLSEAPIRHGYARLRKTDDPDLAVDVLCTTADGQTLLMGRMRLLPAPGSDEPGYMLTLGDVTQRLASGTEFSRNFRNRLEDLRRPAANLSMIIDALELTEGLPEVSARAMQASISGEVQALSRTVSDLMQAYESFGDTWWPMSDVALGDLISALAARIDIDLDDQPDPDLHVHCDSFAIVSFLEGAAALLRQCGGRSLRLHAVPDPSGVTIQLSARGASLPVSTLQAWLDRSLGAPGVAISGQDVLDRHATQCWPERTGRDTRLCLPLRTSSAGPRSQGLAHGEFYDFALFSAQAAGIADDRALADLSYVVFDTETTGLLPHDGDELVQMAAVRIVNQRVLAGEAFDTLVNPGRSIPALATSVHGISEDMVRDAPPVHQAITRFHGYCGDAVLIAHNAPFDMAFLRRAEPALGLRFGNVVLDTVLLSAMLYGRTAQHSLDALTERLGIHIPDEDRHTALGDALATAEAFRRMVPLLAEKGFRTLGRTVQEFPKYKSLIKAVE